jgi:hypothetical protein
MTPKWIALLALGVTAIVILGGAGAYLLTREDTATGRVVINVKDAPAGWTHINVTFSIVKIHQAGFDDENETDDNSTDQNDTAKDDGGWHVLEMGERTLDLAALVDVSELLAAGNVSVGKYTQIRIVVESVTGTLENGTLVDFRVPSGVLKIIRPFTIEEDQTTSLTVDIDLSKSIVEQKDGWAFRPVLGSIVEG